MGKGMEGEATKEVVRGGGGWGRKRGRSRSRMVRQRRKE